MNAGETRAWTALRTRKDGIHVVRQHEIVRYTVDFAIRKARVAIEIDGGVHDFPSRPEYDAQRQAHLESKGWRFVRICSEVTHDAKAKIDAVRAALALPLRGGGRRRGQAPTQAGSNEAPSRTHDSASPRPPTPSPQGKGELAPHLRRRTRANRKLAARRKP